MVLNCAEAMAVARYAYALVTTKGIKADKITVITYYAAQRDLLATSLRQIDLAITVHTVDNFIGNETEVILILLVKSRVSQILDWYPLGCA